MISDSKINGNIILSIRPKYAALIADGAKHVELRRQLPKKLKPGSTVFVYSSSPEQSIIGCFTVEKILRSSIKNLWQQVKALSGLSQQEFYNYFEGANEGSGIFICNYIPFLSPLSREFIIGKGFNFTPPQSFRYLEDGLMKLGLSTLAYSD